MQFKICLLSSKEMASLQGRASAERDRKRKTEKEREGGIERERDAMSMVQLFNY